MKDLRFFETEVDYKNASIEYPNVSYTKDSEDVWIDNHSNMIIMTLESNPEAMIVCYYQGWAKSPYYMTKSEAEAVTDIGTAFLYDANSSVYGYGDYGYGDYGGYSYIGGSLKHFDEFKYFTNVTSIDNFAFTNCESLSSITIPNSVTSFGEGVFSNCTSLSSITFVEDSQLQSIGEYTFNNCYSLTSITIPNSVTSIGNYAFYYCHSLSSIDIPNSVTSIEASAFSDCNSLTSITIPNSVTSIGNYAFYYCTSLSEIICLAETAPTVSSNTFRDICENGVLKVPSGSDYSSWLSTDNYYLGKYNWSSQII